MSAFDFSPLFRGTVGFDRLARMMDVSGGNAQTYPPYNIEKTGEDSYRITLAVAGFHSDELEMTVQDNTLLITGRVKDEAPQGQFLYRGIAARAFERRFVLADHIVVDGAELRNGLLHVALKRVVPESLKPRRIPIAAPTPAIAHAA